MNLAGAGSSSRHLDVGESRRWFGERVRAIRKEKMMTLSEVSSRTGISEPALSKIENGKISVTFENVVSLAVGLDSDISTLMSSENGSGIIGRRTITREGHGVIYESKQYRYEMLSSEISRKKIIPIRATVMCGDRIEFGELTRHAGEEFIFVLKGRVRVFTEGYEPASLDEGDSIYFDSQMGHAVINEEDEPAEILWACSNVVAPLGNAQ